jgi:diguanylate cyclase (GGDEF)-like protein
MPLSMTQALIIMTATVVLLFLAWSFLTRGSRRLGKFDKKAILGARARAEALKWIQGQLEIQIIPGREIEIDSLSGTSARLIKMNLAMKISNPTEYVIMIEEVKWELWLGPVVKTFVSTKRLRLNARNDVADFAIQESMSDADFVKLAKADKEQPTSGYLEGIAVCSTDFGTFEKKFVGFNISYKLKGKIGPMVEGAKPEITGNFDSLTGLLQRKFIEENFQTIIDTVAERQPVSLIMFDVDHFKGFNDTHGHLIGDEILKAVAMKLKEVIGEKGLGIRYGGDEFIIILEGVDSEEAERIAHALHKGVGDAKLKVPQGPLQITLSIGVAVLRHPANYLDLIKMADKALYVSKRNGRNQVTVDHTGVV